MLHAVALALVILERGERIGGLFGLEERRLAIARFAVVHHEFQVWPVAVAVPCEPDFARSHLWLPCFSSAALSIFWILSMPALCSSGVMSSIRARGVL